LSFLVLRSISSGDRAETQKGTQIGYQNYEDQRHVVYLLASASSVKRGLDSQGCGNGLELANAFSVFPDHRAEARVNEK